MTFPRVTLQDAATGDLATIVPDRGAIVTRLRLAGRELLYLEPETVDDPTKKVRGGIPVLFPSPGKLDGDRFVHGSASGALTQHGFAREMAWERGASARTEATFLLRSDAATRARYPWDFEVAITYALRGGAFAITTRVQGGSAASPMPFALGFHPYFAVPQAAKARASIPTRATRAFDNVTKHEVPFTGFDLTAKEVDLHLVDHGGTHAELVLEDGHAIALEGSPELARWVVWTVAGKGFVCLEPWSAPGNALNTGQQLLELRGEARTIELAIRVR